MGEDLLEIMDEINSINDNFFAFLESNSQPQKDSHAPKKARAKRRPLVSIKQTEDLRKAREEAEMDHLSSSYKKSDRPAPMRIYSNPAIDDKPVKSRRSFVRNPEQYNKIRKAVQSMDGSLVFRSAHDAAIHLGLSSGAVRNAIHSGIRAGGHYWRYIGNDISPMVKQALQIKLDAAAADKVNKIKAIRAGICNRQSAKQKQSRHRSKSSPINDLF